MSTTFELRKKLCAIARRNVGKTEVTRNRAPWIAPLWKATSYPDGMSNKEPYCAAGMAWCLKLWGEENPDVLKALKLTPAKFEKWRCKSAGAFAWQHWAEDKGLQILGEGDNFHAGDLVIYEFSHIEMYVDDLPGKSFTAIGYNTGMTGSRDGEGCVEKPRARHSIKSVIRILP
jgi:hypothetical protein